jgi:hypothetical protein
MAARKSLDRSRLLWRVEPITASPTGEAVLRGSLIDPPGIVRSRIASDADWALLKRHNGALITGYRVIRGDEVAGVFNWAPLKGITQQRALNNAFDYMKKINAEEEINA